MSKKAPTTLISLSEDMPIHGQMAFMEKHLGKYLGKQRKFIKNMSEDEQLAILLSTIITLIANSKLCAACTMEALSDVMHDLIKEKTLFYVHDDDDASTNKDLH